MDLVQDHQTPEVAQFQAGILQPGKDGRVFEIEPGDRIPVGARQLSSEGSLADLPRAEERDDGELVQQQADSGEVVLPGVHH